METGKVTNPVEQNQTQPISGRVLSDDELKKLTNFFSILIQIDQKNKSKVKKNDNI